MPVSKFHHCQNKSNLSARPSRGRNRGRVQGIHTSPPPPWRWSAAFQYNWYSAKYADMHGVYSQQVNIMLLPGQKPSSYSLLKVVYVTSQFHHPLVVYPILRKMLDPPLTRKPDTQVRKEVWPNTNKKFLQSQFLFVADQVPLSGHLTLTPQVTTKDQKTKLVSGQLHLRTTFSRSEGVCLPELPLYSTEFQSKGEGQDTSSYQFLCALHPPPPHLYPKSIGLVTLPQ